MRRALYFTLMISIVASMSLSFSSCSSSREVSERRNFMMPKKSEMPRNSGKYKERERKYPKRRS